MPTRPDPNQNKLTAFVDALREASKEGRPIIPIVGAGLSADSGLPILLSVMRYFGKLDTLLRYQLYHPQNIAPALEKALNDIGKKYWEKPWLFIEDFGWPDRFALNQELIDLLLPGRPKPKQAKRDLGRAKSESIITWAARTGLDHLAEQINVQGNWKYDELTKAIEKKLKESGVDPTIVDQIKNRLAQDAGQSTKNDIIGDWRRVILHVTNYQSDYADALFARFGARHEPSTGHRFLGFLAKLLSIRTIFTFNFDSLIETVLQREGMQPVVFGMEYGTNLPHYTLVREQLSVIKMHGSTHALLLDERLDRPLSEQYLQHFDAIVGSNHKPVYLVVGCSGYDLRLQHLIRRALTDTKNPADVLWLHFEESRPKFLGKIPVKRRKQIISLKTNNPGATLMHLHAAISDNHPSSTSAYVAHTQRPILFGTTGPLLFRTTKGEDVTKKLLASLDGAGADRNVTLLGPTVPLLAGQLMMPSVSFELTQLTKYWVDKGFALIWVGLESMHSIAGIVTSIIDQCRNYDMGLPPAVLPLDLNTKKGEVEKYLDLAVEKVLNALERGRYCVAFEGLETYGWPATTHHGVPHVHKNESKDRNQHLFNFLKDLIRRRPADTRIGLSFDHQKSRNGDKKAVVDQKWGFKNTNPWQQGLPYPTCNLDTLVEELPDWKLYTPMFEGGLFNDAFTSITNSVTNITPQKAALALYILVAFRHTRPLPTLRFLLKEVVGDADTTDALLWRLTNNNNGTGLLHLLDGGHYWCYRPLRDAIYEYNTAFAGTTYLEKCLKSADTNQWVLTVQQLLVGAFVQQDICQVLYNSVFLPSQDGVIFLEYVYHRLSSLRALTKLIGLGLWLRHTKQENNTNGIGFVQALKNFQKLLTETEYTLCLNEHDLPKLLLKLADLEDAFRSDPAKLQEEIIAHVLREAITLMEEKIKSLHHAWLRADSVLRKQIPAEQLLHWCDELLKDDLKYRLSHLIVRYENDGTEPVFHSVTEDAQVEFYPSALVNALYEKQPVPQMIKRLDGFRHHIEDLKVRLLLERGDFDQVITERLPQLSKSSSILSALEINVKSFWNKEEGSEDKIKTFLDNLNILTQTIKGTLTDRQLYCLLDISEGIIRIAQLTSADIGSLRTWLNYAARVLELVADESASHETHLRRLYLQVECSFERICDFTHEGMASSSPSAPSDSLALNALETLKKLRGTRLNEAEWLIRRQEFRGDKLPHNPVVDPTIDGTYYIQYRALIYLQRGRDCWRENLTDDNVNRLFKEAYRHFEAARAGLDTSNALLLALIDLYDTEACLAEARYALKNPDKDNQAHADACYAAARSNLRRAQRLLLAGRRNTTWWRFFCHLTAQCHADRLTLNWLQLMAGKPETPTDERTAARIKRQSQQVRKAYNSLREALEYQPSYLPQFLTARRWWPRMWWEITLSGYLIGLEINAQAVEPLVPIEAEQSCRAFLNHLHTMTGLKSELGFMPKTATFFGDETSSIYEEIRKISEAKDAQRLIALRKLIAKQTKVQQLAQTRR